MTASGYRNPPRRTIRNPGDAILAQTAAAPRYPNACPALIPTSRERSGKISGRTQEIQRLVGRSLRSVIDLTALPGHTLHIDCDVLQADGGTRTASINGAYVAAKIAAARAVAAGRIDGSPIVEPLGAISVGIVAGRMLVDLDYEEDSRASVDLNVVQSASGTIIEVQGTSEGSERVFTREALDRMLDAAAAAIRELIAQAGRALAAAGVE
jgi:ribonuclease PH